MWIVSSQVPVYLLSRSPQFSINAVLNKNNSHWIYFSNPNTPLRDITLGHIFRKVFSVSIPIQFICFIPQRTSQPFTIPKSVSFSFTLGHDIRVSVDINSLSFIKISKSVLISTHFLILVQVSTLRLAVILSLSLSKSDYYTKVG